MTKNKPFDPVVEAEAFIREKGSGEQKCSVCKLPGEVKLVMHALRDRSATISRIMEYASIKGCSVSRDSAKRHFSLHYTEPKIA